MKAYSLIQTNITWTQGRSLQGVVKLAEFIANKQLY